MTLFYFIFYVLPAILVAAGGAYYINYIHKRGSEITLFDLLCVIIATLIPVLNIAFLIIGLLYMAADVVILKGKK